MKYKPFNIQFTDDYTVYAIGKKTSTHNIKCGSLFVNSNGIVECVHIYPEKHISKEYPVSKKKEILIKWSHTQDFEITSNTEFLIKISVYNTITNKHEKTYIPYDKWNKEY